MKKRNLKSLLLNKKSISNFRKEALTGGNPWQATYSCHISQNISCYGPCDSPYATFGCVSNAHK